MNIASIVESRDVTKLFSEKIALDRVNLKIPEAKFVGLLGPNGAGKTTLLEIIEGVDVPTSGDIRIFGKHFQQLTQEERSQLGVVFQRFSLPNHLKVHQLLSVFASAYGEHHGWVVEALGLNRLRKEKIGILSVGQLQRLSLAVGLYGTKRLLILDEPTSALDVRAKRATWDVLNKYKHDQRTSAIIATHDLEEAREICDLVYFIEEGRIIGCEEFANEVTGDSDSIVVTLDYNDAICEHLKKKHYITNIECAEDTLRLTVEKPSGDQFLQELMLLEDELGISTNYRMKSKDLESVYLEKISAMD